MCAYSRLVKSLLLFATHRHTSIKLAGSEKHRVIFQNNCISSMDKFVMQKSSCIKMVKIEIS